jgi:tetraacyldisaccharide 4'-kinase
LASPADAGDEPYLIAKRCPGAIVAVGANRYELGRWVLNRQPVDCFVLDDGFQHLGLRRDVDLLLVDATDPAGLEALLPAGRLREPLAAIRRASAVLLTRAESPEDANRMWRVLQPYLPSVSPRGAPSGSEAASPMRVTFRAEKLIEIGSTAVKEPSEAAGRSAVAFSGIGHAASFRRLLEHQGLKIVEEFVFRDHHTYSKTDVERITASARRHAAELILTTEKDAVKLGAFVGPRHRIWAVRLACEMIEGQERLEQLILGVGGNRGKV